MQHGLRPNNRLQKQPCRLRHPWLLMQSQPKQPWLPMQPWLLMQPQPSNRLHQKPRPLRLHPPECRPSTSMRLISCLPR